MEQLQLVRVFLLCVLALHGCVAMPFTDHCVDESFCTYSLQDYHTQLVELPSHINQRSIASWTYVENIDLNRVPQVIHENTFGLETIPVSLRMPVLKKNPNCFPTSSYSLDFELITIACICAFSRNS
uniref:Uncharacterized protein n=1 Tax=Takifugu rubripes TaxID=31033 RepID=A0A3B5K196_TAKRU